MINQVGKVVLLVNQMTGRAVLRQKAAIRDSISVIIPSVLFMSGSYGEVHCMLVLIMLRPQRPWKRPDLTACTVAAVQPDASAILTRAAH
jgi:hypothetical protein